MAIPTVFTGFWCAGSTVGALSGHCGAQCCHVVPGRVVCAGVKATVAPGHDGARLCSLFPAPCVLLCFLSLTLQLFFYTWRNPVSPASQVSCSCVISFKNSFKILCWTTTFCLAQPCVGYCMSWNFCANSEPTNEQQYSSMNWTWNPGVDRSLPTNGSSWIYITVWI